MGNIVFNPLTGELDFTGDKGDPGVGITNIVYNLDGTLTITYGDGSTVTTGNLQGLPGDDGREIELQTNATHIQWRYVGELVWTDLVALANLKGDTGNGIVDVELVSTVGKVKTYRITFTDTTTFDYIVTDGADGEGTGDISGSGIANELAYFTAEKTIDNLPVDTYPSLVEISYIKGLTSAIQTQLNGKVPTSRTVAGKALSSDITIAADDLSDIAITAPQVDQVLKFNGTNWINGNETTVNGGAGVELYYVEAASDISGYSQLLRIPDSGGELDETVVANNNRVLINEYATPSTGIGGTKIDAGTWTFDIRAYVDVSLSGSSSIEIDIFKRTSGGAETLLFTVNSGSLMTALGTEPNVATSVQGEFTINATDRLVAKVYGKNTAANNRTIHFFHGGTTHYSHINSPLVIRHNDLAGINEGDIKHLSAAQLAIVENTSGVNTGDQDLSGKQDILISGSNIKTINSNSLLGAGDIVIVGGGGSFLATQIFF